MVYRVVRNEPPAPSAATFPEEPPLPPDNGAMRVLFIGNSFTYANDLPGQLRSLAAAGGQKLETRQYAPGGAYLHQAATNAQVDKLLQTHWDHVVLQEQSQSAAYEEPRRSKTQPAIVKLMAVAAMQQSPPLLFETWADSGTDYFSMQLRLDNGFDELVGATGITPVPVNKAWRRARKAHPEIDLWIADGHHPSVAGTYLAACVFYKLFFQRSPRGNTYLAGLSPEIAATLQGLAAGN